jgi:hypothetical protein
VGLPEPRELEQWLDDVRRRVRDGEDTDAADQALAYLEADPYYFRSGYARAKLARSLAQASLPDADRARARRYVVDAVAGRKHCNQRELGQLAGAVANNELRAALRAQLHASDHSTARRALHTLRGVRSPGLAAADVQAAHDLVLVDLRRTTWTPPSVARVAEWLWSPEWEAELREIARHHGPDRAGAKHLIEAAERRRLRRRPGH